MIRDAYDDAHLAAVAARVIEAPDKRFYSIAKRAMDVGLSLLAIALLWPVMLLVAFAIRLDSPGSVFFVQKRAGSKRTTMDGHTAWTRTEFPFYKFRSMVSNADPSVHEAYIRAWASGLLEHSESPEVQDPRTDNGPKFKLRNDPRITRIGGILRKTSFDELPQLFNVLKGEMSLVGPRPVPPYESALYKDWYGKRFETLPGLTGWWQVKGRGRVTLEEMIQMDLEYVRNQSLWFDVKILILTIPAILIGEGAR